MFYQMMDVHVMVILATRTLRERNKTQSRVFFRLNLYVYTDVDNRERARARNKKKRNFCENVRHVHRLRVVPHFSFKNSRANDKRARVEITPREKGETRWGEFHVRSRFARSTIPEDKWGTTRMSNISIKRVTRKFQQKFPSSEI